MSGPVAFAIGVMLGTVVTALVMLATEDEAKEAAYRDGARDEYARLAAEEPEWEEIDQEWDELGGPYYDYDWSRP